MELRGMNDRIKKLRKQSEETTPHIFMERAMLMTDAYKKYEGEVSIPELRALSMKEIFSRKTVTPPARAASRPLDQSESRRRRTPK